MLPSCLRLGSSSIGSRFAPLLSTAAARTANRASSLQHRHASLAHTASASSARHLHTSRALNGPPPPPATIKVFVNDKEIEIENGMTVLQACEAGDAVVPRFCYHDRLSIAGNCRMCLVEVEKSPKPVASCAMPAMPGMRIKTDTPLVKKAREGVMEFLLINHPLDCPICDQGGECDLQDQSMEFGSDRGRFREYKRTVEDKNIGPLVKTTMNRCIHCTRCVRYTSEIAGVAIMGTTGRGNLMEVGTYVDQVLDTELSGNVIDLCPVGALTSKPYAFTARPWELTHFESIDVSDALGSNIVIDTRGPNVMRIEPRLNEDVNEEWISDKARFAYDALKRQRLDTPLLRNAEGELEPVTWVQALTAIAKQIKQVDPSQMLAVAGEHTDAETMMCVKDLFNKLNCNNTIHTHHSDALSAGLRSDYLFNTGVASIEDADAILLVNCNPRMESAVLSARIRKAVNQFGTRLASIGPEFESNISGTLHLGNSPQLLSQIASGKHSYSQLLREAKRPMIIVGQAALQRKDSQAIMSTLASLRTSVPQLLTSDWNGVSILHATASHVAALDLGFVPGKQELPADPQFVYLLGADELGAHVPQFNSSAFIVYQGSHGDLGAERANCVLPSPAYTEKIGHYVNTQGRVQKTIAAVPKLNQSREDWSIVRALSEVCDVSLPYDSQQQVFERIKQVAPHFALLDGVVPVSYEFQQLSHAPNAAAVAKSAEQQLSSSAFTPLYTNFFMTDALTRSSATMAKCSKDLVSARNSFVQAVKPVVKSKSSSSPAPPKKVAAPSSAPRKQQQATMQARMINTQAAEPQA